MNIIDFPSPNFEDRNNGEKPSLIVLHYTSCKSAEHALQVLSDPKNPNGRVSAHYLIHEDGTIYRMVDENKCAWHAGVGGWQGRNSGLNHASIGIEISNRSPVIGHSDLAPGRKQDPGYHFPWRDLAKQGIGVRAKPTCADAFNAAAVAKDDKQLRDLFASAGYPTKDFSETHKAPSTHSLISAFQQRYEPEVYLQPGGKPGEATEKTVTMLRAVARDNEKKRLKNLVYKP
jgi:N-acetylmuramoyl-L-alanine amidase